MICSVISLAVLSAFGHVTKDRLNFVFGSTQLYRAQQLIEDESTISHTRQ